MIPSKGRFVTANEPDDIKWIEGQLGMAFLPPLTCFGFYRDGERRAVVVFHFWSRCNVEMGAVVLPGGISRADCRALCDYVFCKERMRRATIITPQSNKRAQRAAVRIGFRFECVRKDYYPDEDGMMFCLLRDDCRWI